LKLLIDEPTSEHRFICYSGLVQHEQIKHESIEQGLIPLLVRCVIHQSFHTNKIRQYALEILLALSFNNQALIKLEQDIDFTNNLRTLGHATDANIQRAANHLLWQLEQKSKHANKGNSLHSKFDIMLSYSHRDKHLCFHICDRLIEEGYRVWIDRDHMHGDTMTAMADAIENSEFVLICMSESYKLSPYCQAEAQYAFERRCNLIPLIMKTKYKPDGWLGFIVSGKIYIDFSKVEFDVAYSMTKLEIEKKKVTNSTPRNNDTSKTQPSMALSAPCTPKSRHSQTVSVEK
jgi:hypothetical protein